MQINAQVLDSRPAKDRTQKLIDQWVLRYVPCGTVLEFDKEDLTMYLRNNHISETEINLKLENENFTLEAQLETWASIVPADEIKRKEIRRLIRLGRSHQLTQRGRDSLRELESLGLGES